MKNVEPRLVAPHITVGEGQDEYQTVVAAACFHPGYSMESPPRTNTLVLAFQPDEEQRARLAAGEAIYLSLLTFGGPMQPVLLSVGPEEPAAWYGVEVTPE